MSSRRAGIQQKPPCIPCEAAEANSSRACSSNQHPHIPQAVVQLMRLTACSCGSACSTARVAFDCQKDNPAYSCSCREVHQTPLALRSLFVRCLTGQYDNACSAFWPLVQQLKGKEPGLCSTTQ